MFLIITKTQIFCKNFRLWDVKKLSPLTISQITQYFFSCGLRIRNSGRNGSVEVNYLIHSRSGAQLSGSENSGALLGILRSQYLHGAVKVELRTYCFDTASYFNATYNLSITVVDYFMVYLMSKTFRSSDLVGTCCSIDDKVTIFTTFYSSSLTQFSQPFLWIFDQKRKI